LQQFFLVVRKPDVTAAGGLAAHALRFAQHRHHDVRLIGRGHRFREQFLRRTFVLRDVSALRIERP